MKEIHRLEEMALLGNFDDYEVMVYEGEGTIPHFHFRNLQNGKQGCIKLLTNEYFFHGQYTDTLNSKERKLLVNFLKSEPKKQYQKIFAEGLTNFDVLCLLWDMNNDDEISLNDVKMPNYLDM